MAATATLATKALAPSPCPRCGEPVITRYTVKQSPVVLDAEPEAGGIYRIDRNGRAERRSLVLLHVEARAGAQSNGYQPHECRGTAWYDRP